MKWTAEEIEVIRSMAANNSAREIGDALGRTKNAIIGCARRVGIQLRVYQDAQTQRQRYDSCNARRRMKRERLAAQKAVAAGCAIRKADAEAAEARKIEAKRKDKEYSSSSRVRKPSRITAYFCAESYFPRRPQLKSTPSVQIEDREEMRRRAVALIEGGMTRADAARQLGISRDRIDRVAKGAFSKVSPEWHDEARRLSDEGKTYWQIAKVVSKCPETVLRLLETSTINLINVVDESSFTQKHIYRTFRKIIASPDDRMSAARAFAAGEIDLVELSRRIAA